MSMNRLMCIYIAVLLLAASSVSGNERRDDEAELLSRLPPLVAASTLGRTTVLPHLEGRVEPGRNYIYCGTMKLAWQARGPDAGDSTPMSEAIARDPFGTRDLSRDSYVVTNSSSRSIAKELREKFGIDLDSAADLHGMQSLVGVAFLQKALPFRTRFVAYDEPLDFQHAGGEKTTPVRSFGYGGQWRTTYGEALNRQVKVLDYRSDEDFIFELKPRSGRDRIVVARVEPGETLRDTVHAVRDRIDASEIDEQRSRLRDGESFEMPIIDFGVVRTYTELNPPGVQGIQFRLDEAGAVLRSYGGYGSFSDPARQLTVSGPFLLCLVEKKSRHPYLVVWIANDELLETAAKPNR